MCKYDEFCEFINFSTKNYRNIILILKRQILCLVQTNLTIYRHNLPTRFLFGGAHELKHSTKWKTAEFKYGRAERGTFLKCLTIAFVKFVFLVIFWWAKYFQCHSIIPSRNLTRACVTSENNALRAGPLINLKYVFLENNSGSITSQRL